MKIPIIPIVITFSLIISVILFFSFFPNFRDWEEVSLFQARIFSFEEITNSPFWDRFRTKDYTPRFIR